MKDLRYLISVQTELAARNKQGYKSGLLHIMAGQTSLTPEQRASLVGYLNPASFQRINLLQPDADGLTPLAIAFENGNVDFIEELFQGGCDTLDLHGLLHAKDAKVDPICSFFAPTALD